MIVSELIAALSSLRPDMPIFVLSSETGDLVDILQVDLYPFGDLPVRGDLPWAACLTPADPYSRVLSGGTWAYVPNTDGTPYTDS
jgi:hypothetical protein